MTIPYLGQDFTPERVAILACREPEQAGLFWGFRALGLAC
jgi:hypothetical protein